MHRDEIKKIALDIGFELKDQPDGNKDLNEYVYYFADVIASKSEIGCKGPNCNTVNGRNHSEECLKEHDNACNGVSEKDEISALKRKLQCIDDAIECSNSDVSMHEDNIKNADFKLGGTFSIILNSSQEIERINGELSTLHAIKDNMDLI